MPSHQETKQHKEAFDYWYDCDRNVQKTSKQFRTSERSVYNWMDKFGWHEKADRRDMQAQAEAEAVAIDRRRKMIEAQRSAGAALRTLGMRFLQEQNKIENIKDATLALKEGFALERQAEGLPDWVGKILNASDEELRNDFADLDRRRREAMACLSSGESASED